MPTHRPMVPRLVEQIREEFEEAPGLEITVDEGVRFWAIDPKTCEDVLSQLHEMRFLVKAADGRFRRRSTV